MYTGTAVICNPSGLHARPASDFVGCAGRFKSRLTIRRTGEDSPGLNGKSIVLLLSQGFSQGEEIELTAQGEDEEACVKELLALVTSGFGEV